MMDSKQRMLIRSLSETVYHTSEELGELLGVSSKTARTMVKAVREKVEQNGAIIEAKSRKGFRLVVTDRERFDSFCHPESPVRRFTPNNVEDRVYYILVMLLSQVEFIKLEDIADELFVSKYTVTGDLHRVEALLSDFSLEILRRPNYGIKVTGRETDIRNCMVHLLGRHSSMMADGGEGYRSMTKEISQILLEAAQLFDLHFSEFSFRNITNMICASMHRMLQRHIVVISQEDARQDLSERTLSVAEYLSDSLQQHFGVQLPESEKVFLALNIAGKCNYGSSAMSDQNVVVDPALNALTEKMLQSIYEAFKLDFRENFLLRMNLELHMVAMDIRLRYNMPVENPLLQDVQKQYPLAYALAEQASIPLRHAYQTVISDDEIGYLAFIIQLALEQEKSGFSKKNILVVCVAGMASARLIGYRLKEEYSKYLDQIYVCDYYRLDLFDLSKVDYIFTSLPIRKKVNVPIVQVEDFFDTIGARAVRSTLENCSADYLMNYYRPDLFFPHLSGRTKEEAIANLCQQVNKVLPLPQGFYESVLQREELARTDFCSLVAFPHAYRVVSDETFVAVGILDEPIHWVKNDVQVLLLISIADKENPDLQKFYTTTTSFMQDTRRIKSLLQYRDFSWFLQLLCRDHKGTGESSR